jgi:HEXXH motif-containing protein
MCGGGNRAERELWRAAHVSKRMAQLRAILDTAGDDVAAMAGLGESFDALAEVQRHDPGTIADLLGGPQVGSWAAHCLRLLNSDAPDPEAPLWTHLAHLGAIAASAAVLAGHQVRVMVPVRSGAVYFPTLGRGVVPDPGRPALTECVAGPNGILLDGAPTIDWEPVRPLRTSAGGVSLDVQVDDVDPHWAFGIPASTRLTDDELGIWRDQLAGAWQVLADRHGHRVHTIAAAVRCLVPVQQAGKFGGVSASSANAPGAVALSTPVSPVRLAATLIHESQHYRLATLHDLRPLYRPSRQLHYSPWRNDSRPVSGVVHALMAFTGVADFWSREHTDAASELEYARHVRQLRVAHDVAAATPELTPLGAALVNALGDTIDAFPLEPGNADVRRIAEDLVTTHRASWRLRNIVPHEREVRAFRTTWRTGAPPPVEHSGRPAPGDPGGDNPLTRVAMAWLENEPEVRALATDEKLFGKRFPGAVATDVRLIAGDYDAARADALTRIADGTADDHTWVTLVVAHSRACTEPARSPLAHVPELVRAALSPEPGVGPLTELLSRYEAGTSTSDSMRR